MGLIANYPPSRRELALPDRSRIKCLIRVVLNCVQMTGPQITIYYWIRSVSLIRGLHGTKEHMRLGKQ